MPWEVVDAAEEYGEVVFVCLRSSTRVQPLLPLAREFAETLIVDDAAEAVARLAGRRVCGVVTYSDNTLLLASAIAQDFGCRFHTTDVAWALTDKHRQREVMRQGGGIAVPAVHTPHEPTAVPDAAERVGFPSIVKPRQSCESRHTYRLPDRAAAEALVPTLANAWSGVGGFIVEELYGGDESVAGAGWGDYVSVESLVVGGTIEHLAVLGKFPLVEPFRETGEFYPHTLADGPTASVLDLATDAIAALGIQHGACHTEIKFTPRGPRVIEVNGRLGGGVDQVMERALGVSALRTTIAAAVGAIDGRSVARWHAPAGGGVSYQVKCYPARALNGVHDVVRVTGLDRVKAMTGVAVVRATKRRGDRIDAGMGGATDIAHVFGVAPSHEALRRTFSEVSAVIDAELTDCGSSQGTPGGRPAA